MACRQNGYIGGDPDVVPEAAIITVKDNEVVVGKKVLPHFDTESVIAFERGQNITIFPDLTENIGKKIASFLNLRGAQLIVFADGILDLETVGGPFSCIIGIIEETAFSFFLFGHTSGNGFAEDGGIFHFMFHLFKSHILNNGELFFF